ncbi:MAG: hypothetical protein ABSG78_06415 [Verrucomicrobiota bacterium]
MPRAGSAAIHPSQSAWSRRGAAPAAIRQAAASSRCGRTAEIGN